MDYILLILGFIALVKGADLFVDGSSSIAKILKVPSVIIGLTIVALGTSLPEASVSILAGLSGNNDMAISNVLGSNAFNSLVVVGLCSAIVPFATNPSILKRDFLVNISVSILLFIFILDYKLSSLEGIIFLIILFSYMFFMIKEARSSKIEVDETKAMSLPKSLIYVVVGVAVIILGGNLVVSSASNIATAFGLSQTLIGLTIVAIGTSLPELVTSLVAVHKKDSGLALGNAIGSNILNIVFILGASSALSAMTVTFESIIDCAFIVGVSIMMYIFGRTNKEFSRTEGIICVSIYVLYTIYLIMR